VIADFLSRINENIISQFIDEVLEGWDTWLETLSLSDSLDETVGLGSFLGWIVGEELPMIEGALWEGSSGGGGSEGLGETEGLTDWQVCLHDNEWGTSDWLLTDNNTSSLGKSLIDTSYGIIWSLDLTEEDWLLESWLGGKLGSVHNSSGGWDDLTTTSMDGISVEGNIMDVESHTSHVLITQNTFFGGPLEGSLEGILDFVQVLDTLSDINEHVWSLSVWTEAPNLLGISLVPLELLNEGSGSLLWIRFWSELLALNHIGKLISEWLSLDIESVMLVW
jgi:hypothetical protein